MTGDSVRLGVSLPIFGPIVHDVPLGAAARRAEEAGFDSVWVSDHVVMTRSNESTYPFSDDGTITWDAAAPRYDALISMATAAEATASVTIGVAVLIAPLRNPLVLAKQIATIDVLSGGRVVLGVGSGWYAEEYEAVGVDFSTRGRRLDDWIAVMRATWTGTPDPHEYEHFTVGDGLLSYPTPVGHVPILIGGNSPVAVRRAGSIADGWLGFQRADALEQDLVAGRVEALRRDAPGSRAVVRLTGRAEDVAAAAPRLISAGVDELIVETDWLDPVGPESTVTMLRAAIEQE